MKCNHDRNVRSFAKETLGSTRTGRAMRFAAVRCNSGCVDMVEEGAQGLRSFWAEAGVRSACPKWTRTCATSLASLLV